MFQYDCEVTPMTLKEKLLKTLDETHARLSVSEIASLCGFSDLFYFSRSFRGKTGLTPSEYRKNYVLKVNMLEPDRFTEKNETSREERS